jgi:hypothetical protein
MGSGDNSLDTPAARSGTLQEIKLGEHLRLLQVHRDGPRFFCAALTDGARRFQLKAVLAEGAEDDGANGLHTPTAHLRVEMEAVRFLTTHLPEDESIAPRFISGGLEPSPWYASECLDGRWLGLEASPFFYDLEALPATAPASIFDSLVKLQCLTSEANIPASILDARRARKRDANIHAGVAFLASQSERSLEAVTGAVAEARATKDALPLVLCHGEAYPPHLFSDGGTIKLIDWENARLDDSYVDHAAVWLRAFELPDWQEEYLAFVRRQEGFSRDGWTATVFLMALDNYRYLSQDDRMPMPRRKRAIEFCKRVVIGKGL